MTHGDREVSRRCTTESCVGHLKRKVSGHIPQILRKQNQGDWVSGQSWGFVKGTQ